MVHHSRRAVYSVQRIFAVLKDIKRTGSKRVIQTGRHSAIRNVVWLKLWLTRDHFIRRRPSWPLALILNSASAFAIQSLPAKTHPIAQSHPIFLSEVHRK